MKFELALGELVTRFHDAEVATRAQQEFVARVSEKTVPADLPPKVVLVDAAGIRIGSLLKEAGLAASTSEANRKIEEGAVRIDGERVTDRALTLKAGVNRDTAGHRAASRLKLELKT